MAYGDFKDLAGRTASDKVLGGKAFYVAKSPKYGEYQRRLASMVYIFFIKNLLQNLVLNLAKEKYIHRLIIIFKVLVLHICN